jgi:hypothetical protein
MEKRARAGLTSQSTTTDFLRFRRPCNVRRMSHDAVALSSFLNVPSIADKIVIALLQGNVTVSSRSCLFAVLHCTYLLNRIPRESRRLLDSERNIATEVHPAVRCFVPLSVASSQLSSATMSPPSHSGTFQPLQHRSGTLRERLHSYTKRTLGAGGSINEAVRLPTVLEILVLKPLLRHR